MRNDLRSRRRAHVAALAMSLLESRKQDVMEMLGSCGVSPQDVPLWPALWRDEGGVHIDRYVRNEEGNIRVEDGWPVIREEVIQPSVIPEWIAHA